MRIFKKIYKYKSGKVIIKSDIPLETEDIDSIIEIINRVMTQEYYEPYYLISREIYHKINHSEIRRVEADKKLIGFTVKILK